jgi:hypothetical protein
MPAINSSTWRSQKPTIATILPCAALPPGEPNLNVRRAVTDTIRYSLPAARALVQGRRAEVGVGVSDQDQIHRFPNSPAHGGGNAMHGGVRG